MVAAAAVLDPITHPHIFEAILTSLSFYDTLPLRGVSSAFLDVVDGFLARHIYLSRHACITHRHAPLPFVYGVKNTNDRSPPSPTAFLRCIAALRSTRAVTFTFQSRKLPPWVQFMILPALSGIQVVRSNALIYLLVVAPTLAAFTMFKHHSFPSSPTDNSKRPHHSHAPVPFVHEGTLKLVLNISISRWLFGYTVGTFNHPPSLTRVVIVFDQPSGTARPATQFGLHAEITFVDLLPGSSSPGILDTLIANALDPLLRGVKYTLVDVDMWSPQFLQALPMDNDDGVTKLQERLLRVVARPGHAQGWTPDQVLTAQSNLGFVSSAEYRAEVGTRVFAYETNPDTPES